MRALVLALALLAPTLQNSADEQYSYVAALAEKGLAEQVVREAQLFLRAHPEHPKADHARYRLATAHFDLRHEAEALPVLVELARRPGFEFAAEVQFRLGQCLLAAQQHVPAEAAFQKVLQAKKESLVAPALALLGQSELARKDHEHALARFEELLTRAPKSEYAADARCGRAWCLYRLGRAAQAASAARSALESVPAARRGELAFLLGECLLDVKDARGALEAYRSVSEGPYADAALRGAAFARAELGDHAGAAEDFGALLERFPDSALRAECALQQGVELQRAGRPAEALAALARPECARNPEALAWRARVEESTGEREAALASVERALALQPAAELETRLVLQQAQLLAALGRTAEARRAWESVGNDRALLAASVAELAAQRFDEAAGLAAQLLQRFPASPLAGDARLALAEAHYGEERWNEAEEAYRSAARADLDAGRGLRLRSRLAWCAYLGGDLARAGTLFDELARSAGTAAEIEEAAFMSARAREDAGDTDGAAQAYDRCIERFPAGAHRDEAELRGALACAPEAACARLEALATRLGTGALAARARFELAERRSQTGHADQAIPHYRRALEDPAAGEYAARAGYGLAWSHYQVQQYDESARELERLLARPALEPALATAARELAVWCAVQRADLTSALARWRELAAPGLDEERSLPLLRTLTAALLQAKRPEDARAAIDAFERVVRTPRARSTAALERALLFSESNRPEEALQEIEKARAAGGADPAFSEALFRLGEARYAQGADAQAIGLYDAAAQEASSPVADRALYKAGFARLRSNDVAGAERCFQRLVDERPKSELLHETLFLLGEAQFRQKRFELAITNLERVRREAPRHAVYPKVLFRLGLALGERQRWKESADVLATLVRTQPDFPNLAEAELGRGRALGELGDARGARAALERVLALDQGLLSAQAHLELGRLAYSAGDLDLALSEFLKVAVLYEGDEEVAEALVLAGRVLEEQKQPEKARAQYREALEQHPKARYAAEAQKRLAELGKQ